MMAFSAGGRREAICRALKPPQEIPVIPTFPFDQGWRASHAITSVQSLCSIREYSRSGGAPSLVPVPRMSTRALT